MVKHSTEKNIISYDLSLIGGKMTGQKSNVFLVKLFLHNVSF